ncbi:MAG: ferrous iron transporter B [Clostridia bacterium]|nr:ferrous iron transporter B [Clostridia bacterium]
MHQNGERCVVNKNTASAVTVAFAGNPNVGKSTLFNALTGLKQHTGNWAGKTVENAVGRCRRGGREIVIYDLPGCYSAFTDTAEETAAAAFLRGKTVDVVVTVISATAAERGLRLFFEIKKLYPRVILCLNMMDEAAHEGVVIDIDGLSKAVGVPVVALSARKKQGIDGLIQAILSFPETDAECVPQETDVNTRSHMLFLQYVSCKEKTHRNIKGFIDKVLTNKYTAFPVMIVLLLFLFWLTITGANYPSELLSRLFTRLQNVLTGVFLQVNIPPVLTDFLLNGIYRTLSWVVAVMLPPMAVFFPLFTLAEDCGLLPRIAFDLDRPFCACSACGKQALTMCMGLGCNAVGVTGCRIIESPRERLIAVLTNSLVPCNGRFPILMTMAVVLAGAAFRSGLAEAVSLTACVVISILCVFAVSKLLSVTILRGVPSFFVLEIPPLRRPEIGKTIVRSLLDRTIFVLGRAVTAAIPAGALIWLAANISVGDKSLITHAAAVFEPLGTLMGIDGIIFLSFLLALPANEIILPVMLMAYLGGNTLSAVPSVESLSPLLAGLGWTKITVLCVMIFTLFHWPCATTIKTVKKETGSGKYTALAILIPSVVGILLCIVMNFLLLPWKDGLTL